jgi:hypothetical protein
VSKETCKKKHDKKLEKDTPNLLGKHAVSSSFLPSFFLQVSLDAGLCLTCSSVSLLDLGGHLVFERANRLVTDWDRTRKQAGGKIGCRTAFLSAIKARIYY